MKVGEVDNLDLTRDLAALAVIQFYRKLVSRDVVSARILALVNEIRQREPGRHPALLQSIAVAWTSKSAAECLGRSYERMQGWLSNEMAEVFRVGQRRLVLVGGRDWPVHSDGSR